MKFLAAMELGGVLVAALERWLRRNDQLSERRYRELRKAYSGLLRAIDNRPGLEAMDLIQIEGDLRYWVSRVLLVFLNIQWNTGLQQRIKAFCISAHTGTRSF